MKFTFSLWVPLSNELNAVELALVTKKAELYGEYTDGSLNVAYDLGYLGGTGARFAHNSAQITSQPFDQKAVNAVIITSLNYYEYVIEKYIEI